MMESSDHVWIIHALGFAALGCSLAAMSMKDLLPLRLFSTAGNLLYIVYGVSLGSAPLVAHGAIVIAIHAYHIHRLFACGIGTDSPGARGWNPETIGIDRFRHRSASHPKASRRCVYGWSK